MGKFSKRRTQVEASDTGSEDEGDIEAKVLNFMEYEEDDNDVCGESGKEDTQEQEGNDSEMEELEKEFLDLRQEEQDLLKNLKHHKDEDLLKGQAIKSQKALWDKNLELRFLLQKAFTGSNRLPQEPIRSSFCTSGDVIEEAYSDLITSSKKTMDSLLALQRVLLEKNPSITQVTDGSSGQNYKHPEALRSSEQEVDEEWLQISEMHSSRVLTFSLKSHDELASIHGVEKDVQDLDFGALVSGSQPKKARAEYFVLGMGSKDKANEVPKKRNSPSRAGTSSSAWSDMPHCLGWSVSIEESAFKSPRTTCEWSSQAIIHMDSKTLSGYGINKMTNGMVQLMSQVLCCGFVLLHAEHKVLDLLHIGNVMHCRKIALFRDKSIDKWQRKTQVTTGAAAIKGRLQAFNQNISEQVAAYMRDPSRMIKGMQQRRSAVAIFGTGLELSSLTHEEIGGKEIFGQRQKVLAMVMVVLKERRSPAVREFPCGDTWYKVGLVGIMMGGCHQQWDSCYGLVTDPDGDPELLDDSEFYQQLLKEFFEAFDSTSSETAFYVLRRLQTKKRKVVDRRASKSRKIRYNVHEKIVNFMAPQPMDLPPMAPKLFENLFGLKTRKPTSAP
ncbi:hypothetical protein RJ639_007630 [Escallonia herrerae]|uniref:Uncharacterized protein n=1 Tax=Escallonia herrerae TaxID=1293975 RepID=A0AA88VX98_9ASTE|nr:hypothetical protein RJ639_007630 [Escallonia herrerae]